MAFNKLMRALGFRGDDEDYDDNVDYPSALPVQQSVQTSASAEPTVVATEDNEPSQEAKAELEHSGEPDFPLTIFDSLLQVFNDAQPDFIRKCLDVNAQRRYLYDSIDASFKEYIGRYQSDVRDRARAEAEEASAKLREELVALREKVKAGERLEEEVKHQRISADRQKRTFNERIRDLEGKVGTVEAEKEQLQLEIKSLLNKVKVAAVHEKDAKAYKEDLDNLRKQMKEGHDDEMALLRDNLDSANQRVTAMNARNMALEAEAEKAKKDLEVLKKVVEEQRSALAEAESRLASMADRVVDDPTPSSDIPAVEPEQPDTEMTVERKPRRRKKKLKPSPTKISAIDETLDETEWLVATPPEGTVAKTVSIASDSDFGYQEPPRKQPPVNDAQMSLF